MKQVIYQFWDGDIPTHVQDEINDLKAKAEAAGFKHEMYDLNRLLDELNNSNLHWDNKHRVEDVRESLRRMKKYLPISLFASACSDFFRYWCLQEGGVYMDTDVLITTETFPELPGGDGVFTCSEQTHTHKLNTCVTVCNGQQGMTYAQLLTFFAADRLMKTWLDSFEQCKANAQWLIENKWSLINYIGPGFVRHYLPFLTGIGVKVERMPYELCSSHNWKSAIWHAGDGTWVNGGKGNAQAQRKVF